MSDAVDQLVTPGWVMHILNDFETRGFFDEIELCGRIGRALRENQQAPAAEQKAAHAEFMAFGFHPQDVGKTRPWSTHFGPHFTRGEHQEPDLANVDASVLAYWGRRMGEAKHPLLRARYADLVWDLSQPATSVRPSIEAARTAVDAYVACEPLADDNTTIPASERLTRGLQIALQIQDKSGRIEAARDALFALFERFDKTYGWVYLFDTYRDRITAGLERHIADVAARPQGAQPVETLPVASRLASYYRKVNREADARRVLLAAGEAVERCAAAVGTEAMLAHAWLDQVYGFYRVHGLQEAARRVLLAARKRGAEAEGQMPRITTRYQFSQEEVTELEAYLDGATSGTLEQAFRRIVNDFLPNIARLRETVEERGRTHPLLSLFGVARISEGQVVGRSGPPDTDPDGALVHVLGEFVNLSSSHLAWLIDRVRQKFSLTSGAIVAFLYDSPVFAEQFCGLITQGLDAYLADDHVKAISVLVPQIENALRRFLHLLGQPPNKPRRGDPTAMTEKTLSDILEREQAIRAYFGEDIVLYLLTFLADPREQNLRNRVSHGLMTAPEFHRGFSDRVLHILLLLACIRPDGADDGQPAGAEVPA